jgi:16S rRNA (guanine(966)-N(2))-methyltransferase RsmD
MRIITGKLKGRRFHIPKGQDVRPTTDRTRESMFNKIEAFKYLEGATILDLFGGSGSLGFEAISRGARSVTYVDINPRNITLIEKVAAEFEVDHQITTVVADVQKYIAGLAIPHDFVFAILRMITRGWMK